MGRRGPSPRIRGNCGRQGQDSLSPSRALGGQPCALAGPIGPPGRASLAPWQGVLFRIAKRYRGRRECRPAGAFKNAVAVCVEIECLAAQLHFLPVAEIQDVNRVALEAGNSPRMIFQHYRELCTPDDARTWFALAPEKAENILPMLAVK